MQFLPQLKETITQNNSLLCVGLDTDLEKIPGHLQSKRLLFLLLTAA